MKKEKKEELYYAHLYDVHKENSVFLNKALLSIPSAFIVVLLNFFDNFQNLCSKIFFVLSFFAFFIAIVVMIISFFHAISSLDKQLKGKVDQETVASGVDIINIFVSFVVVFGILCVIIAVCIEYFILRRIIYG